MNPKRLLIFLMLAFASTVFSQTPGFAYDKETTLCVRTVESDLIVTGTLVSKIWIVDPEKKKAEDERWKSNMEDLGNIPKPEKFLLGTLYTFNVSDILLDRSETDFRSEVFVFVKGNRALPLLDDNTPYFLDGTKYLIYLKSLAPSEIEKSSKAMNPGKMEINDFTVPSDGMYEVTSHYFGYFPFNEGNSGAIADAYRFASEKDQKCSK